MHACYNNALCSFRDKPDANARIYKVFDNGLHVGRRLWRVSHIRPSGFACVRRNSGGPEEIAIKYIVYSTPKQSISPKESTDVSATRTIVRSNSSTRRTHFVFFFNGAKTIWIQITRRDVIRCVTVTCTTLVCFCWVSVPAVVPE